MKVTLFYYFVFVVTTYMATHTADAQITVDNSAISVFWEIADTLSTNKNPSSQLWEKFADHPAYAQLEIQANRVRILKKTLPLVFKPSYSEKLNQVMEGEESLSKHFAKHLQEIRLKRKKLEEDLKPLTNNVDSNKESYVKCAMEYLPDDIKKEDITITIYIALFEDNGFGGKDVVIDLLHVMNGTQEDNAGFFGHEFHHSLREKTRKHQIFKPKDSIYYPITAALNKLPLEGVACLINKTKYFDDSYLSHIQSLHKTQQESIKEFQELVKNASTNLQQIDQALAGDLPNTEKRKQLLNSMPWGGHSVGFYMARAIEKELGKQVLIKTQYSCIDFIFMYQKAAEKNNGLYVFSDKTIEFLKAIE